MKRIIRGSALIFALAATVLTSACSSATSDEGGRSFIDGTRAVIYQSLDELVADTEIVVTATVTDAIETTSGGLPATKFSLTVLDMVETADLSNPTGIAPDVDHQISVVQYGNDEVTGLSESLKTGETYLLFLVATQLAAPDDFEYFVTGISAGIYVETGDGFASLAEDGDRIPKTLTVEELRNRD